MPCSLGSISPIKFGGNGLELLTDFIICGLIMQLVIGDSRVVKAVKCYWGNSATCVAGQMSASRSLPGLLQTAGEVLCCSLLTGMLRKDTVIYDV